VFKSPPLVGLISVGCGAREKYRKNEAVTIKPLSIPNFPGLGSNFRPSSYPQQSAGRERRIDLCFGRKLLLEFFVW